MNAAVIPFPATAHARAILRWRVQAWSILGNPAATWSQRHLALRFLQEHGQI